MEKNEVVATKKEHNYRGIKAMPFVIGNETFEKLGTIGTSSNMLVYLSTVFNMSSISATNFINIFNGTCNFGTLIGAFLSDTYLGRYKTLGIASISSFTGMLVLSLTAAFPALHPPKCATKSSSCVEATPWQLTFLFSAFGLLIIGSSGIRPCNLAFGADQFNPNTDSGRRGINSFFNWYYFTYTFAMMISLTLIVYVQANVNWAIGLGIPAFLMFLSCAFFFIGTKIYVKVLPEGSPLASMAQTIVVSFKKRKLELPDQPWTNLYTYFQPNSINTKLPYTDQFRFLNKAAIITPKDQLKPDGTPVNRWGLCSIQQVEELKCVIRVIPIWIAGILYYVIIAQMQTYVVFQAIQSDRHLGSGNFQIPAASYIVFMMLSLSIWIPIYDRLVLRLLRRMTRTEEGVSLLQRVGIGMVLAIVTMTVSALVEGHRRTVALTRPTIGLVPRKGAISSMSGLLLVPQLAIAGISEAFAVIGLIEFFYKQFPENMRSFASSFVFCASAMASYLSSFLISVVHRTTKVGENGNWLSEDLNKGRLDYFYYLVAALEVLNLGYFLICAKYYKYKTAEKDDKDLAMETLPPQKPHI